MIEKVIEIVAKTVGFNEAKAEVDNLAKSEDKLTSSTNKYSDAASKAEGALQGLLGKVNIAGVNLGDMYGQLKDTVTGFGDVVKGAKSVTAGINLTSVATGKFALALAATGIGAIAIALGVLVAAFLSTQEGMDAVNKVIQPLIFQFQALWGIIQDVSKNLGLLLKGDIVGFFKKSSAAVGDFSGKMDEASKKGSEYAQIQKDISKAQVQLAQNTAKAEVQLENAKSVLEDVTASEKDRIQAVKDAKAAIDLKYDAEANLLALEIEALKLKQSLNDVSDQELIKLAELEGAYTKLTAAKTKELVEIDNKERDIIKTQQDNAKAAFEARKAQLEAQAQLEAEFAQERLDKQREFEDFQNSLIADEAARNLAIQETNRKRIIEDINFESAELAKKYAGDKEKLAQIEEDRVQTIKNADLALQVFKDEQAAKEEEKRIAEEEKAKLKLEQDLLKVAEFEEKRRLLLQEYKLADLEGELLEEELAAIKAEEDLAKYKAELDAKLLTKEEYDALVEKSEQDLVNKLTQINNKYREEEKKKKQAETKAKIDTAQSYANSVNTLTQSIFDLTNRFGKQDEKNSEKRAKRQFAINKALQLANAGISLASSISTQLAAAPLVVGVVPNVPAIVALAATAASGAAQLATIAAAKFESANEGSSSSATSSAPDLSSVENASAGPTATAESASAPNFTLFGQANAGSTAQEGVSNEISNGTVIRAFVTESDITGTQQRLSTLQQASEL